VLNHCRYTTSHRYTAASANGATETDLAAVARGDYKGFTDRERIALLLAEEMTTELPVFTREQSPTGISAHLRDAAKELVRPSRTGRAHNEHQCVERLVALPPVMEFDLDMPEPPPAVESVI